MRFEEALEFLRHGYKVARMGRYGELGWLEIYTYDSGEQEIILRRDGWYCTEKEDSVALTSESILAKDWEVVV